MDFDIHTIQGEHLQPSTLIPQSLEQFALPCSDMASYSGSFGDMLFQTIHNYGFNVRYNNYNIRHTAAVHYVSKKSSLELQIMLGNDMYSDVRRLGTFQLRQHQFNMTYLPFVECITYFDAGAYSNFEIHYSVEYLEKYAPMLPVLEPFLVDIANGVAGHLLPPHPFASPEMLSVVNQILSSKYIGELQKIYLDIKSSELLFLALRKVKETAGNNSSAINKSDEQKMYDAKSWLENNIDCPATIEEIAKTIGTNPFKLKKGFKEVFGTTVFDYLLNLRMEKAKQLLSNTDKSISEIAFLTGYSSHSSFTQAFSKHFGFAPLFVRKR